MRDPVNFGPGVVRVRVRKSRLMTLAPGGVFPVWLSLSVYVCVELYTYMALLPSVCAALALHLARFAPRVPAARSTQPVMDYWTDRASKSAGDLLREEAAGLSVAVCALPSYSFAHATTRPPASHRPAG